MPMYFLSLLYSFVCFPLHFPLSSLFLVFQVASAILQFSFPCHSTEFPQVSSRPPRLFPPFPHCSRSPRPSLVFHHGCESRLSALPLFLSDFLFFCFISRTYRPSRLCSSLTLCPHIYQELPLPLLPCLPSLLVFEAGSLPRPQTCLLLQSFSSHLGRAEAAFCSQWQLCNYYCYNLSFMPSV